MPTCAANSTRLPTVDAVRDLHEVVDLGARPDPRLTDRRTIDGRIGADFDVVFDDDVAVLRDLEVRSVRLADEPEAVAADHRAVLHDHPMADPDALANRDVRVHDAVVADHGAGADHDVGKHDRACADDGARRRPRRMRQSTRPRQVAPSDATALSRSIPRGGGALCVQEADRVREREIRLSAAQQRRRACLQTDSSVERMTADACVVARCW